MDINDLLIKSTFRDYQSWQLGQLLTSEWEKVGVVLLWISEERGVGRNADIKSFERVKNYLFQLSKLDFEVPVFDLGNLISGKTIEDTKYALEEILLFCHKKGITTIVVGGGEDLSFSLFSSLNELKKNIHYTHFSPVISLENQRSDVNGSNYLSEILSSRDFSVGSFHLLGYQKHLNDANVLNFLNEVNFDVLRLAELMNRPDRAEPFLRRADLVTINCDVVESFTSPFSIHPQVNGLNSREVCALMKEIGLGENLKSVGIFNYNFETNSLLSDQLLAQMIWYLLEGINIQKTHPTKKEFETYYVMLDNVSFTFRRDTFRNLWYFGEGDDMETWIPCSAEDIENAKKGILNKRFLK